MLKFFDCNVMIGPRSAPHQGSCSDVETLQEKMEIAGVEKALIYHSFAKEHEPVVGNMLLHQGLKLSNNFIPSWVAIPNVTGDFMDEDELLRQMRIYGIRALRIFPGKDDFNFPIHPVVTGRLFNMLEKRRIPIFIDYSGINWMEVLCVLERFKNLRTVFTNVSHKINREIIPLLHTFKNFYLETSVCKVFQGIEFYVGEIGSERLIFGSGLPVFSIGSAVTLITHADISDTDKENIAFRNLEGLLEDVRL